LCFAAKLAERGKQLSSDYVKSGAASIEGRAKRSPNGKGRQPGMDRARAGVLGFRGGVVAYAFFVDGCSTHPGRGFIARMASEQSEHRYD